MEARGTTGKGLSRPMDYLIESLRSRTSARSGEVQPVAVLWTDPKAEWHQVLPVALLEIPELLVLGDYSPEERTGPAIWLRCVIDGTIDSPAIAGDHTPIIYVSDVERDQLRAGEDCPDELKPLVELLYRAIVWHHPNGRDWSATAFLSSPKGAGLDIATDQGTTAALLGVLDQVLLAPIDQFRGRRLDAADFNRMAGVDVMRDILRWMADPEGARAQLGASGWKAFCAECWQELEFDPATEADMSAAAKLGEGAGRWTDVWTRFSEAPNSFPGVAEALVRARPVGELALHRERWPDQNDEDEETVRNALAGLLSQSHGDACETVVRLEAEHRDRREWVWAKLGRSPFARVLEPLARLAESVRTSLGGTTPDDVARAYADRGWLSDASAREALALAPDKYEQTVADAVRHLLESWLDDSARAFQASLDRQPLPSAGDQPVVVAGEGECVVFVDGLRYELGRRLVERLEGSGCRTTTGHRWAAIPTVTATAKPAVTPAARDIAGDGLGPDFRPVMRGTGRAADQKELRGAMEGCGYQIVDDTLEFPMDAGPRGWMETGEIDKRGHQGDGMLFARLLDDELGRLARRINDLLKAGWRAVRVVTDHGWLLLPGGLPMVSLPKHLTASKWARCAVISGDSRPDAPLHSWHWNRNELFATPPGIACFSKRDEYAHGGLSVQECLIPDIRVESAGEGGAAATILGVSWLRFRCNVNVEVRGGPLSADLRLGSPAGQSVASSPKRIDEDGLASLVLADDQHADAALVVVVTDPDGRVLAQKPTRAGDTT